MQRDEGLMERARAAMVRFLQTHWLAGEDRAAILADFARAEVRRELESLRASIRYMQESEVFRASGQDPMGVLASGIDARLAALEGGQ